MNIKGNDIGWQNGMAYSITIIMTIKKLKYLESIDKLCLFAMLL